MKKLISLLLFIFILCGVLSGCSGKNTNTVNNTSSDSKSQKAEYSPGTRTDKEFRSEWIGIKYTLSDDMAMATEEELESMMQIGADMLYEDSNTGKKMIDYAKVNTVYEMMASDLTGNNVIVMAEKLSLSKITVEQYITAFKQQLEKTSASTTYSDVTSRTVAGIDFTQLTCTLSVNGASATQTYLFKKMENRMIGIVVTHQSPERLDTLLQNFSAIE